MDGGREIHLQLPGIQLAARAYGSPRARPLLALHGWLDHCESMAPLAAGLAGWHVVALDLPGHGRSEHNPAGVPYGFVDMAARVAQAMDALGWARCAMVGHSLGAALAIVVAGSLPDRVDRLVLLDALGPLVEPEAGAPDRLADALAAERARRGRQDKTYATMDEIAGSWERARSAMTPGARDLMLPRAVARAEGGLRWAADPALRLPSRVRLTEGQTRAFLRRVVAPTLVLWPDAGVLATKDPPLAQARLACLARARVVSIAGGHHVHLERPEDVLAAVQPFLDEVPPGAAP